MPDSAHIMDCPKCGSRFDVTKFNPGQKFLCKKCRQLIVVPESTAPETAVTLPFFIDTPPTGGAPSFAATASDFEGALSKDSIGGCKLTKLLGRGGMGAVFLGTQISLDRPVAVKILPKSFASNKDNVSRFEREARAVARLNHPNIVQVFDMGQDSEGTYFIVMEFVEGSTLSEIIKEKGKFSEKMALGAMAQACSGIQAAHEAGILHRDIKPENLMLNNKGRIKIADFGLAKHVSGSVRLTGTGIALGTPAFMAPEQGMGEEVDARADIYSLGGTLFTLITGRLPFEADSPLSMMMKHATEPVPAISAFATEVSKSTEDIIFRSMAKTPKDRFANAQEMRKALLEAKKRAGSGGAAVELEIEDEEAPSPVQKKAGSTGVKEKEKGDDRKVRTPAPETPKADDKKAKTPKPPEKQKTPAPDKKSLTPATPQKTVRAQEEESETARDRDGRGGRKKPQAARPGGREQGKKSPMPLVIGIALVVLALAAIGIIAAVSGKKPQEQTDADKPVKTPDSGNTPDGGQDGGKKPDATDPDKASQDDSGPRPPVLPEGVKESSTKGEYVNKKDGSVLLWVPGGEFERGMTEEDISSVLNWFLTPVYSEYRTVFPKAKVKVRGFFICKYEITNEQYAKFLEWVDSGEDTSKVFHPHEPLGKNHKPQYAKNPSLNDPAQPVVGVDWYDAIAYARWAGMDLPTEAQWEKAALWDNLKKKRQMFPWGDAPAHDKAAVADAVAGALFKSSHEYVKWSRFEDGMDKCVLKKAREYSGDLAPSGGLNFAGNVSEWMKDYYDPWFYSSPESVENDPFNNVFTPLRAVRGGNYHTSLERFFRRFGHSCEENKGRFEDLGFRCAVNLAENPRAEEGRGISDPDEIKKFKPAAAKRVIAGNVDQKIQLKQYEDAAILAKIGEKMFPDSWEFPFLYGKAKQSAADAEKKDKEKREPLYLEAAQAFEKSAQLDSLKERKARSYAFKGACLRMVKKNQEALDDLNRSASIDPNQSLAFYQRALLRLHNLKEYEEARSDFKKALSMNPDNADAWYYIGICEQNLKNAEAAVAAFSNDLILSPGDKDALYLRGVLYIDLKKPDEAKADFSALITKNDLLHGHLGMAKLHMQKSDWKKAMDACDSAMAEYPVSCEEHFQEARNLRAEAKQKAEGK